MCLGGPFGAPPIVVGRILLDEVASCARELPTFTSISGCTRGCLGLAPLLFDGPLPQLLVHGRLSGAWRGCPNLQTSTRNGNTPPIPCDSSSTNSSYDVCCRMFQVVQFPRSRIYIFSRMIRRSTPSSSSHGPITCMSLSRLVRQASSLANHIHRHRDHLQ